MGDDHDEAANQGANVYRKMREKIAGIAPEGWYSRKKAKQPDLPMDYEVSARELVENIMHPADTRRADAGRLGCREQIVRLYTALDRENTAEAIAIMGAMGDIKNVDAADVLAILLEYPDEAVRTHAAQTLGRLGQRTAVESLIRALDDRSDLVGESVALALGMIGDNKAEVPLQTVSIARPRVKKAAVSALAQLERRRI